MNKYVVYPGDGVPVRLVEKVDGCIELWVGKYKTLTLRKDGRIRLQMYIPEKNNAGLKTDKYGRVELV